MFSRKILGAQNAQAIFPMNQVIFTNWQKREGESVAALSTSIKTQNTTGLAQMGMNGAHHSIVFVEEIGVHTASLITRRKSPD